MYLRNIAALTFFLAVGGAMASDNLQGVQTKQEFVAMKAKVDKDLGDGVQYKEISPEDQKTLIATLAQMDERWKKIDDGSQASPDERVAMANDQEVVTTILQHASKDSRVICERIEPLNTHRSQNVCKTVAQRRRETDQSQDSMRQNGATTK